MDDLTRERFGPAPRRLVAVDEAAIIAERRRVLCGLDSVPGLAEAQRASRLRAAKRKRDLRLVAAIRRAS